MRGVGMWTGTRSLTVLVACCVVGLVSSPAGASGEGSSSTGSDSSLSLAGSPLVVSGVQSLDGGQQAQGAEEARLSNPEAVEAREASQTSHEGLDAEEAATLAKESFPGVVDHPAGGPPQLPEGQHVTGIIGADVEQVDLGRGNEGVVESLQPFATESVPGHWSPVDLGVSEVGGSFRVANPVVGLGIPKQLQDGVSLSSVGVSLTPVDGAGAVAGSAEGQLDGSVVFYSGVGVGSDVDELVKPTTTGFSEDAVLRSQLSPERLFYRVGMPVGASLEAAHDGSGAIYVIDRGIVIAMIVPPSATDAAGTSVPVSMGFSGHMLTLAVKQSTEYQLPIEVDPEISDSQLATTTAGKRSNWEFYSSNSSRFTGSAVYNGPGNEHLQTSGSGYAATEWAYWGYQTRGNSKIWEFNSETEAHNSGGHIESFLELEAKGGSQENKEVLSTEAEHTAEYSRRPAPPICPKNGEAEQKCVPTAGGEGNAVHFQQSAAASGSGFSDTLYQGVVALSEPTGTHSNTSLNTTSPMVTLEVEVEPGKMEKQTRQNVLYGSGGWLSKYGGAVELISKDPGIGVSATQLEYEASAGKWEQLFARNYLENENACKGVQCYAEHGEGWTVDPRLANGEDKIRYRAEEAMSGTKSTEAEGIATVKVDTATPRHILLEGLPFGNELSERAYKLKSEVTDGEGATVPSSGVKSIALFVDNHELNKTGGTGACLTAKGECTANEEWTINGAELGAGHHAIVIVSKDNAGNEARRELSLTIRHSTPVSFGPGSVDLQSGDFTLGATDVAMGSGLTLSRNYSSRDVTAGSQGPLGPQWSLSLGSTESLVEMVDGGVLMTAANGSQSIFANLGEGKFESPPGDSNLQLSLEENTETKQKLAYYLKNPAAGTSVKFTRPAGSSAWVPTIQEGPVATDTVSYSYRTVEPQTEFSVPSKGSPYGIVAGSDGNLWFTAGSNKVGKITTAGVVSEYSLPANSFPSGIVAGADGNLWFTEGATSKIGKITTAGVVSEYALPANSFPSGIAAGPDGNLWFTKQGKVGKITTSGVVSEYAVGSTPASIVAASDGNLWFAEASASKIGKITTSGTVLAEYALPSGGEPRSITVGPDGNLWFAEYGTNKVGKITTAGVVSEYALPAGSHPEGIAKGPDSNLWFAEYGTSKIGKITTSGSTTEYTLPMGSEPRGITAGPDNKLWFTDYATTKIGKITTVGPITEPTKALAPVPAGVSCAPELLAGCRALTFTYATKTTASGEARSEWGECEGRLMKVSMNAYNPSSKKVEEAPVAQYSYDKQCRLRAEWDPRISPVLETAYGYDGEGHVTALTPAGEESWSFTYGTAAGDSGAGRLVKTMRSPASSALWSGSGVANTGSPQISGTPDVGVRMAVSNGTWSGTPIAYGYQWEDCNTSGGACAVILGATNANYTVQASDIGHTLLVQVTATNGDGSVTVTSAASPIAQPAGGHITEFGVPSKGSPYGIVAGSDGNLWFTAGSNKVGKITTAGVVSEYSLPANSFPSGIVAGADGNLWFTEGATSKIGKITTAGVVSEYALPANSIPSGIAAGPDGNLWFTKQGKVGKITTSGVVSEYAVGSTPASIVAASDGNLWFAEASASKIGKITTSGTVLAEYALPSGGEPRSITVGPDGNLWFAEYGTNKVGKITTAGVVSEYALPAGSHPEGIVKGPDSNLWFAEYGTSRIGKITTSGTTTEYTLPMGSEPRGITPGPDNKLWFTDYATTKIGQLTYNFTPVEGESRPAQPGATIEYNVPMTGAGAPHAMNEGEVGKWGQTDEPVEGTAILPPDSLQGWPASSYTRATIYYLDEQGRNVNVATPSNSSYGAITTTEYNETNDVIRTLSPANRVTALEAGSKSVEVSKLLDTQSTYNGEGAKESEVAEPGTRLIESLGPQHMIKYVAGTETKESLARNHTKYFYDEGAPSGETFDLLTKTSDLAQLANEEEVEVRKTTTSYSGQESLGWKLRAPTSTTVDPEGKKITHTTLYNKTTGQIIETRGPGGLSGESAHDGKTVYYSSGANTEGYPGCGNHPEWASLICETLPAKQPGSSGPPKLPVTIFTYNVWNEPEITTETFGSTTRTKTQHYDTAGRPASSETTATTDSPLPKVTDEYSKTTGLIEKQSTSSGEIKSIYNKLGQRESYTDTDGNTTTYKYGGPEVDNQLEEVSDAKGTQIYTYDETTRAPKKLWVSGGSEGLTFTASYNVEGKMTSETYPNGMCANYTYNSLSEATGIAYIKTTNCSENNPTVWYSQSETSSIHGAMLSQESTLASDKYTYDTAERLTEVQETPTGEGCKTRIYADDEESNRTTLTTRAPNSKNECATEGGTVEKHTYDEANRLTDTGVTYDNLGNITKLPAADAGEGGELTSAFYVDGQVATQTQNGEEIEYSTDPTGRVRKAVSKGKTTATVISHYDAPGEAVAWTSEGSEKWTRDIPGIDGTLSAVESSGASAVLQLHDLQGDIVATAALNPNETKLLSTYNSTEFGVPNPNKPPPKYAFLGAAGAASELGTGVITYGTTSYDPQTGSTLQTEEVEPPGAPEGTGAGTPVNFQEEPWNMQGAARAGAEAPGLEAGREREAEEAARRATLTCQYAHGTLLPWGGCRVEIAGAASSGPPTAQAAFDHTWRVPGPVAFALGSAISVSGTDVGGFLLGIVRIPKWVIEGINHMFHGRLQEFAGGLMTAGGRAEPGTLVTINLYGSLKYGLGFKLVYVELPEVE